MATANASSLMVILGQTLASKLKGSCPRNEAGLMNQQRRKITNAIAMPISV
jgi:hypothetical protein